MSRAFLDALRARLGEAGLLVGGDLSAYENDWRKRYAGKALAVARPASTDEVAAVLRLCHEHRVAVVPQGGNTGLVGGSTPDDSGAQLVLNLSRMKRIRGIDAANASLTAEAGCVLAEVQAAAAQAGLLFPLSLAAEGSCTLGGNLATNAGGTQVLRYGNARELCLGLEVVTATGEIWHGLSGLRKDNTGYDLRDLFIGSEGTLGVITAATMKLYPQPRERLTALAACASMDAAVASCPSSPSRSARPNGRCCWSCPMHKAPSMRARCSRACWRRPWSAAACRTPPSRRTSSRPEPSGTCASPSRWPRRRRG
jgi:FAD/FMN-containing dehydrogenase